VRRRRTDKFFFSRSLFLQLYMIILYVKPDIIPIKNPWLKAGVKRARNNKFYDAYSKKNYRYDTEKLYRLKRIRALSDKAFHQKPETCRSFYLIGIQNARKFTLPARMAGHQYF
jgi:hypothetical protein